jgi:MSHA biogenesis protein MshM
MAMYLEHFGLGEPPFRITPHIEFFFAGANRGATLEALIYAVTHDEGIVKVSGEVGSGKTMLCRVLIERLPENVVTIYLANPTLSRDDMLFALADELELELADDLRMSAVVRALQTRLIELYAQGRQVVVLIDEAHAMARETLEEIRLLSNLETSQHKLLQLVMFGQPELDDILAQPNMRQLKERITQNFSLEPLRRDDIGAYLEFRMRTAGYRGPSVFSPPAIQRIARASQGLTRRVNILADKALLAAFAGNGHEITRREVDAAVRDAGYEGTRFRLRRWLPALGGVAVTAAIVVLAWQCGGTAPETPSTAPGSVASAPIAAMPPAATGSPAVTSARAHDTATPAAAPPPAPAAADSPLQKELEESRQWIASADGERWFVQLVTIDGGQTEFARSYYARARRLLPAEQVRVYRADTRSDARFGVIFGDYPTWQAAQQAVRQLPAELLDNNPFPRQLRWLK